MGEFVGGGLHNREGAALQAETDASVFAREGGDPD
jgi:hypothetical protein